MITNTYPPANDLSVQQLRSFCRVFEEGSYSAAAKGIGLAVPTVWEQVQAVERCYGAVLFRRRGRQIAPTPVASVLYKALGPIMVGLDSTFEVVHEGDGACSTTVTLVTGMRMLLEELGGFLKCFSTEQPHVSLRLLHGDTRTAEDLISAEKADLGLTLEPGPNMARADFTYEQAYEVDYLALIPQKHPLAEKSKLRLQDVIKYPLVVGHHGTSGRRILDEALHREGLLRRAKIAVETDNGAFTAACVRAGLGVGILAGKAGGPLTRDLVGLSLRKQLGHARIVFMWRSGRHLTRAARSLIDLVKERGKS